MLASGFFKNFLTIRHQRVNSRKNLVLVEDCFEILWNLYFNSFWVLFSTCGFCGKMWEGILTRIYQSNEMLEEIW